MKDIVYHSGKTIVYIIINNWDDRLTTENAKYMLKRMENNEKGIPFNYSQCLIDLATFYFITSTVEDLKAEGLEEFLKFEFKSCNKDDYVLDTSFHPADKTPMGDMFTMNMFRRYNPDKWDTDDNGTSFDIDALHKSLYIFVDWDGYEYMSNARPVKVTDYVGLNHENTQVSEAYDRYKDAKGKFCPGWMHYYNNEKKDENPFCFYNVIELPTGFIEKNFGMKWDFKMGEFIWNPFDSSTVTLFKED